ncbi:MAG: hypothetical protein AAF620_13055 [Bacteroidota bacterium]
MIELNKLGNSVESKKDFELSTAALRTAPHDYEQIFLNDIIADREGYILAYLSNENAEEIAIHWDDFTVYHGKTNVVYSSDFYPGSATFNFFVFLYLHARRHIFLFLILIH